MKDDSEDIAGRDNLEDEVAIEEVDSIMEGPAPSTSAYKNDEP